MRKKFPPGSDKLIFPCSGMSDTGEIADRAARLLTREKIGRMCCLAGVSAGVEDILEMTQQAVKVLAINGCDSDCVNKTLQKAGFSNLLTFRITDLGMEKGKSPATEERVATAAMAAKSWLLEGHGIKESAADSTGSEARP